MARRIRRHMLKKEVFGALSLPVFPFLVLEVFLMARQHIISQGKATHYSMEI